jgi:hypothetical protein
MPRGYYRGREEAMKKRFALARKPARNTRRKVKVTLAKVSLAKTEETAK